MGISKTALLEGYYFAEIDEIIAQWNALHNVEEEEEEVDPMTFFGGCGEVIVCRLMRDKIYHPVNLAFLDG
jgi:hypothetical protein